MTFPCFQRQGSASSQRRKKVAQGPQAPGTQRPLSVCKQQADADASAWPRPNLW